MHLQRPERLFPAYFVGFSGFLGIGMGRAPAPYAPSFPLLPKLLSPDLCKSDKLQKSGPKFIHIHELVKTELFFCFGHFTGFRRIGKGRMPLHTRLFLRFCPNFFLPVYLNLINYKNRSQNLYRFINLQKPKRFLPRSFHVFRRVRAQRQGSARRFAPVLISALHCPLPETCALPDGIFLRGFSP